MISKIIIENVKGIKYQEFQIEIKPNIPNILVAPNGFGKTSFAIAFDSLKKNGINLDYKFYHDGDSNKEPRITLEYKCNDKLITLIANYHRNSISEYFDCVVINNRIKAKGFQMVGASSPTAAQITVDPIILINTVPTFKKFQYSLNIMQKLLGAKSNLLSDISYVFQNQNFIKFIKSNYNLLDKCLLKKCRSQIDELTAVRSFKHISTPIAQTNHQAVHLF